MTTFSHGTFNWVDLSAKSIERVRPFYEALFGWTYEPSQGDQGYGIFMKDQKSAAGIGQMSPAMLEANVPSTWNTYVSVDDIQATEAKAKALGGTLMFDTVDVLDVGRMNFVTDPEGALFAMWQPLKTAGAETFNVPNTFCWNERATRDMAGFKAFYGELFGWSFRDGSSGTTELAMIHNAAGAEIGHALLMTEAWGDAPPAWMVYFAVAQCEDTCREAEALGGEVCVPPTDIDVGRFAVLGDPDRAYFYVIQLKA
ncbi:MAG: VOC family protein [Myxococcota bacterium]